MLRSLGAYSWRVLGALIIVLVGLWLAKLFGKALIKVLTSRKLDPTVVYFVDSCLSVLLYGVVLIAALHRLGVETTSLVAILGAAGLAIGLALGGQLSNVASGLLILIFRPFSVGEYIEGGGSAGKIEKIELMSTEIRSPENVTVIIPNSKLTSDKVINYSRSTTRRLRIVIGVSYKADLKKIRDVLQGIVEKEELILKEPEPSITIKELGDKGIKVEIRVWVKSEDYLRAKVQLNERIKEHYDSEDIPYP
ncbi:MAG: mechanosensitive ion channel domain-containing protein [Pseudomonadota bacterium]